jgi:hypothetical protein
MAKFDLSKLNRQEKLALIDAAEEKRRRAIERREAYVPNEGQAKVHKSKANLRAVFAGNGGGKSALGVNEALWACTGYNPITKETSPVPARVIVVIDKPDKVDTVWLPEIKKWYPLKPEQLKKNGKPYIQEIQFDNGSHLLFFFHDQEPMSFESIELDFCVFDEPPPRHVFIALKRGGRKKNRTARFLIIGTPISAAWLRTEIYEPWSKGELPDAECFRYGTSVNQANLSTNYMKDYGAYLSEKEKAIRFDGAFFDLDGLALAHLFNRKSHVIEPPKWPSHWPCVVAIDPHPSKAHKALLLGVTQSGALRALKSLTSRGAARQFAKELKAFMEGHRVVDIVADSLGNSDSTGGEGRMSFIQVLIDEGVRVRATTYDEKKDEAWISMIQDVLLVPEEANQFGEKLPKLQISSACTGLISDIETVCWAKVKNVDDYKPKLDITRKDDLSCLKYALAAQPRYQKGRETVIGRGTVGLNRQERWRRSR